MTLFVDFKGNRTAGAFLFCGDSGHRLNLEGTTLSFTYTLPFSDFFKSLDRKCREQTFVFIVTRKSFPSSLLIACSYCLRLYVLSVGKLKYVIFSFFSGILVTFLIAFRYAARGRHYRKQARTLTELLHKLTNQGLTSLVLALFGPGYPSVSPFMEWVYALFVLTL